METIQQVHDFIISARLQFSQGTLTSEKLNAIVDECIIRLCQIGGAQGKLEPDKKVIKRISEQISKN